MANEKNLIPFNKSKLSKEEVREINRKGGLNSAKVRKERKTFAEIFKTILDEKAEVMINGVKVKIAKKDLLAINLINKTMTDKVNNNTLNSLKHIQATIGEAPIERVEQTNLNINTTPKEVDLDKIKKWREEDK